MDKIKRLAIIGCGLMGGSFALALKKAQRVEEVIGYSKSPSTTERARRMGVIDRAAESAMLAASNADVVLLAIPVSASEATLRSIEPLVHEQMLVMDVGSTKRDVVDTARRVLKEKIGRFVPAHPIAGSERAGVQHAEATLYEGRQVILTPLPQTDPALVQQASELWQAVGAQVVTMTADNHDAAFGAVSHLPHLLAFAYMSAIINQPAGREFLALAGPGFRDFTRIAASDPTIWRDILTANREETLKQSQRFRYALERMERAMFGNDASTIEALIREASDARALWRIGGFPPADASP